MMINKPILLMGNFFFASKNKNIPLNPKNILVIRSGGIGDVLMTTTFLQVLRNKYKKSKISYLVGEWSKEVLEGNNDIDEIISFDDNIIFNKKIIKVFRSIHKLRKKKFDLCFILDKSYLWNLFAFFSGIPFRVGFDRYGEGFPNNLNVPFEGKKNEIGYYLDILRLLDIDVKKKKMKLPLSKNDIEFSNNFLKKKSLTNKKIVGIAVGGAENPGQNAHIKRWPKEKYIELINVLNERENIILFGGKNDFQLNEEIINAILIKKNKIINAAGISLKQSSALMKKCRLFITHDSGAMHIAAAMDIKLIALFGPTPAERFAPRNAIIITSKGEGCPCYDIYGNYKKIDCMEDIKVKDVLKNIKL